MSTSKSGSRGSRKTPRPPRPTTALRARSAPPDIAPPPAILKSTLAEESITKPNAGIKRKRMQPDLPHRRLRVYALDPSIAKSLDSMAVNETILTVPWDDRPGERLMPGPVGEYLEVIDIDPASNRVYDPVDLNDEKLLAQDGWPPSEGNPQFHQQMVYAVGMATICQFEQALGRRALWAPYIPDSEGPAVEVRRLRLYPHALRTRNAYYSPAKKALLFGYFPAESDDSDNTAPGSMVFSCLSSDIISHEMTHALLDGLHRRYELTSNPDVPAFHEALADIVALFQHFMIPELVRFEISRTRGDVSAANLLGGLARQFGEGSSRGGPLRNYLDPKMRELKYAPTLESHQLGSILVYAVYEAFLKAVAHRTASTIRLATGGSGILPAGSLHPELVQRLTEEICVAAKDVLHMCIRALDYCPAVDITFGEYLRAIITADRDLTPEDTFGHRVAFMEAFRHRGILPRDVRTISEETLAWGTLEDPNPAWLPAIVKDIDPSWDQEMDRSKIFHLNEKNCRVLHQGLLSAFKRDPSLYAQFGLIANLPRFNAHGGIESYPAAGESTFEVHSVRPTRRVAPDGSFRTELIAVIQQRRLVPLDGKDLANGLFWFDGGATLILEARPGHEKTVRYSIIKNTDSKSRMERQRFYESKSYLAPLRELYFGKDVAAHEPFAVMHADTGDSENV